MATTNPTRNQSSGTDPVDTSLTDRVTGPHTGFDKHGRPDHSYYHCQRCGAESTHRRDLRTCC